MFFIGIFGINSKNKEIREIQNIICKACGTLSSYKLVKTYDCFEFFFIPLFRWNTRYYLVSRCCGSIFEIPIDLGHRLEDGENISINDLDLKEVKINNQHSGNNICPNCGRLINGDFTYCPYCGSKIK